MELLGHVEYSPALQRADLEGRSILGVDPKAEAALVAMKERLEELIAGNKGAWPPEGVKGPGPFISKGKDAS
jgi:hypothetical protein